MRPNYGNTDSGFSESVIPRSRFTVHPRRNRDSRLRAGAAGAISAGLPYSNDWQPHRTLIPEPFNPHPDSCRRFRGFIVSGSRNLKIQRITDLPTLNRETGAKGEVSKNQGTGYGLRGKGAVVVVLQEATPFLPHVFRPNSFFTDFSQKANS